MSRAPIAVTGGCQKVYLWDNKCHGGLMQTRTQRLFLGLTVGFAVTGQNLTSVAKVVTRQDLDNELSHMVRDF